MIEMQIPERSKEATRALPMPHKASQYGLNISPANFANAFCQVRDCVELNPQNALLVGIGTNITPILLRVKYGIQVTTLDIDSEFEPDIVGSVSDMQMFHDKQFDVAIVSHVLEHLPFSLFFKSLCEIGRVSKHALIYLPYGGRHVELKLSLAQRIRELNLEVWIPPYHRSVSGEERILQGGEHYWEIGYRGFSRRKIREIMKKNFTILKEYQNKEWKYSLNYVLRSCPSCDSVR